MCHNPILKPAFVPQDPTFPVISLSQPDCDSILRSDLKVKTENLRRGCG